MATAHAPAVRRRGLVALALTATAVAGVVVAPGNGATAEPRPSLAEVERRVEALDAKADAAVEDHAEARLALGAARRSAATATARLAREQARLAVVQREVAAVVAAAYRRGGPDAYLSLVATRDPQAFLDRAASLDRVARTQAGRLSAVATARHRLEALRRTTARELAAQQAVERKVAAAAGAVEQTLRAQRALLAGLEADERRRLEAARRARAEAAQRLARASRARSVEAYTGPASGRAGTAVAEAYRKLGSPYQWAAAGPSRFDCSGLTMWVWGKAGVSLPHSSRAQYAGGRKVSRSALQPGDLVFYGSPIHHVGIYVGGGRMISAPRTGDVVKLQNAFRSDYTGAVRP